MNLAEAIKNRRSVRRYSTHQVERNIINKLLDAAVQAPTATNAQPWAFTVIQDIDLLKKYSDEAKKLLIASNEHNPHLDKYRTMLSNPNFNIFYTAQTLIVLYGKSEAAQPNEDCSMAAQNLMLMAHSLGLGTCWIGFAVPFLSLPEIKHELRVPPNYDPVAPIIVGYPAVETPPVPKNPPIIFSWQ